MIGFTFHTSLRGLIVLIQLFMLLLKFYQQNSQEVILSCLGDLGADPGFPCREFVLYEGVLLQQM